VRSAIRLAGVVVLACEGLDGPATAQSSVPSPKPSAVARRRPVQDSVDRAVDAVLRAHEKPCERAERQGVPCFPVTVEQEGPRFSVAEALRRYRPSGAAPGTPTSAETRGFLSGAPLSASGGVGFDPVCIAKRLFGTHAGTTFYLYRTWDARGERPLLTERPLDPEHFSTNPDFRYALMGTYSGECEAIAAWRKALREARAPEPLPDDWDEVKDPPR
jgi:hypothetical protein